MNMKRSRTASFAQRAATMCSPPVSSVVSPKQSVEPSACSLSNALPTVGLAPQPDVVSLSPHRSEEHTSELQSRRDLVCRLLLEKKKKNKKRHILLLKRVHLLDYVTNHSQ